MLVPGTRLPAQGPAQLTCAQAGGDLAGMSVPPPSALEQQPLPHPHILLHFQQDTLVLLSDCQGGTVNPLVNLLPFLCLKGVESFPSVTHPKDTESKVGRVSGTVLCGCASSVCQLWLYQDLQGQGGCGLGAGPQYT